MIDPEKSWRRLVMPTMVLAILAAVLLSFSPRKVAAQQATTERSAAGTSSTDPPLAPGLASNDPEDGGAPKESMFQRAWKASGLIGVVIAAMSFYLIAAVVWMAFQYRRSMAVPPDLIRELNDLLSQRRYSDAYQRLAIDRSFLAQVLAAGVRKLPNGQAPALRAMEMANDDATMEMEHRTTYLATVGTLGPMIGLVGTVYGMIISFGVIATAGASPQAGDLAAGISTALYATLEGIAVSIPAIYFYALFRNRIARLSLEVAMTAESLLEQFSPGVRNAHPLAAAATSSSVSNMNVGNGGKGPSVGNPGSPRSALPPADRPL